MVIKYLSKCIVCNVEFISTTNIIDQDNTDSKVKNSLVENFCAYFNVNVSAELNSLTSKNQDYFCVKCKQMVVQLLDLYEQLLKIQTAVKKTESVITKTILETGHIQTNNRNDDQNEQPNTVNPTLHNDNTIRTTTNKTDLCHASSDIVQLELDQKREPENFRDVFVSSKDDLIESHKVWRQIRFIRRSICDHFLPTVLLSKFNKKHRKRKSAIKVIQKKYTSKRRKRGKLENSTTLNKDKPLSGKQRSCSDIKENSRNTHNEEDSSFKVQLKGHEQELSTSDLHPDSDFDHFYEGRGEREEEVGRQRKDEEGSRTDCVCELCGKIFKNRKNLEDHKGRHSKKFAQNCQYCNKEISSKQGLLIHMKTVHESTREYECHVCKLKVGTEASLKRHLKTHESSTSKLGRPRRDLSQHPFDCELCESTFLNKQDRMNHLQTVHSSREISSQNVLKCEKCEKTFTKLKLLRRHMVSHSDKRTFMCFKCNKCFKTSTYLSAHVKRHDSIKKFSCNVCNSSFKTKASLIFHQETIHEGKRRDFPCSICGNKFTTAHAVKRHILTHSQIRNFMCETCGSKFQQNSTLRRHIAEVHNKIPPKTQRKTPSQRRAAREAKSQLQRQETFSEYLQNNSDSNSNIISPTVNDRMQIEINPSQVPILESTILQQQEQQQPSSSLSVSIGQKTLTHDIRLVSVSNDSYQSIMPLTTNTSVVVNDTNFEIQGISSTLQFSVPFSTTSNSTTTPSDQNQFSSITRVLETNNNSN